MRFIVIAAALFALSGCSGGGMGLKVTGGLPHPVFEVTSGIGAAPCLTGFRVGPSRPASASDVAAWSVVREKGCLRPALVLSGNNPDGFADRFPSQEGATSYRPVHWPAELSEGPPYLVTVEAEGGKKANFLVEFAGGGTRVSRR